MKVFEQFINEQNKTKSKYKKRRIRIKNRGYVTVFVTLMLVVMLIVAFAVIKIADMSYGQTKASTALSSAMSSELANYNRYVYDRYHILLLDKCDSDSKTDYLEQDMRQILEFNLGDKFCVDQLAVSGYVTLMEDDCSEFKKQINDNFKYDAVELTVNKIIEKAEGNDEPVNTDTISNIEADITSETTAIEEKQIEKEELADSSDNSQEAQLEEESEKAEEVEDPREALKTYTSAGIASIILPSDVQLSSYTVDKDNIPSKGRSITSKEGISTSFEDKKQLELDSTKGNGWSKALISEAESVAYATNYFNSLTDKKFTDTALNLEQEYLIAGKDNDGDNYRIVVDEILLIRFGFNFAYIITDSVKMEECDALSLALCSAAPALQPVVKYLLAGCWSYIESIADVYRLLRNHKVPYTKGTTTWLTDFETLAHLSELDESTSETEVGLSYEEYLMILMSSKGKELTYRMLDLIQVNTMKNDNKSFKVENCITAFSVDAKIIYKDQEFNFHEEAGY